MRLTCSNCGHVISADDAEMDAEARQVLQVALTLPVACQKYLLQYLRLFSPPGRVLVWKKARRLTDELAALVASGHVQRGRYPARDTDSVLWGDAMRKTVENPPQRLPLKTHGFLTAVVWDMADRSDRKAETARNAAERRGNLVPKREEDGPAPIGEVLDKDWMRKVREEAGARRLKAESGISTKNDEGTGDDQ